MNVKVLTVKEDEVLFDFQCDTMGDVLISHQDGVPAGLCSRLLLSVGSAEAWERELTY